MGQICSNVRNRLNSRDIFITPTSLVKRHLKLIDSRPSDIWYDPFKLTGNYFKAFPVLDSQKRWAEIRDQRDFFTYDVGHVDIICSNPPYSCLTDIFKHSVYLKPRIISFLIGLMNLTRARIIFMNENGYGLTKLPSTKVNKWFGESYCVVFEKGLPNMSGFEIDIVSSIGHGYVSAKAQFLTQINAF